MFWERDGWKSYDILMLVILAGATLFGAWKGVAWQLASLASLVLSYLVALRWSEPAARYFGNPSPWDRFLAMLVLYALCSLIVWWLFRYVRNFIDRVQLKGFDHQLGALLGAAKGVLWCIGITFFAITLSPPARDQILHSRSGYYIAVAAQSGRSGDSQRSCTKCSIRISKNLNKNWLRPPRTGPSRSHSRRRGSRRPDRPRPTAGAGCNWNSVRGRREGGQGRLAGEPGHRRPGAPKRAFSSPTGCRG